MSILTKICTFFVILLLPYIAPIADDKNSKSEEQQAVELGSQLVDIKKSLQTQRRDLEKLNLSIEKANVETDKKALLDKKEQLLKKIESLMFSFEEMATGGVKISDYTKTEEKKPFNWQEELLEIFKPMMAELKALTERSRAIDRLRTEKSQIEEHLPIAVNAIKSIQQIKPKIKDAATLDELNKVEAEWLKRTTDLGDQAKLVAFQLEQKLNPPDDEGKSFSVKLHEFILGRGLTIFMAIATFIIVFIVMASMSRRVEGRLSNNPNRQKLFFQRAMNISLKSMTVLFALLAMMLVLYFRNDWLLLGLLLIILFGLLWALRHSLPKYVREVKLMLNMGPVREGERVNYQGIPWRVTNLNFYTTLENPALSGGAIKLPVDVIVGLNSRPHAEEEGWFPNETGDYVILDNDLFGPVILQTPDVVQMRVLGGSIKTFSSADYLALNPRNISAGFGIFVNFGLDYDLQSSITEQIPKTLKENMYPKLQQESFGSHILNFDVVFNQASGSSLDVAIIAAFSGAAAPDYFAIRRAMQRHTVEICTQYNWNIPFDNVTVHLDKES